MGTSVMWFRRDLRLNDNPALLAAVEDGEVVPLFVLDPRLADLELARTRRLLASLAALDEDLDGALLVRRGDPRAVVAEVAAQVGAARVHVSRESTPYGRRRDADVQQALESAGRELVATGTPYAVAPGRVLTKSGTPFQVFTPFWRAWAEHGWPAPAPAPRDLRCRRGVAGETIDAPDDLRSTAGERHALQRWHDYRTDGLEHYADERDRPDLAGTSQLSVALKLGEVHPRTLLAQAGPGASAAAFVRQLCWREFYADVLYHQPRSAWHDLRPALATMQYDSGPETDELVTAWKLGRTGYPVVDAGMRQLLASGWMHNRVRLLTASFLVKDLHVWWPVGARHFLDHLLDGDLANNNHGWQWVAGTGTDASPYFRVFNPVTQGLKFDPDGDYVRRWVPELAHLAGAAAHQPWKHPDGYAHGYPEPVVDHDEERRVALARYEAAR